jgi:hypothetical protein
MANGIGRVTSKVVLLGALGCSPVGGFVAGGPDTHCGSQVVTVDQAACSASAPGSVDFGDTHEGSEADDDDCKYHIRASSTDVRQSTNVTFSIVVTRKTDDSAVVGADPSAEVFLTPTHPAPNSSQTSKENPAGTYRVGPIRFDASGRWTVRFHLFESCADLPESPHGHVAFFVDAP